ncbi:tetratricopeptide repeat protein [bacterium]|nr:tetratricopeptide repeat protein [bacterium]
MNTRSKLLSIALILMLAQTSYTQSAQDGSAEFECLKTWSTGSEYWKNKEYPNAIPYFWKAMDCDNALHPKDSLKFTSVYEKLADSYYQLKKFDSAIYVRKKGYAFLNVPEHVYAIGEIYHHGMLSFDSAAHYYRKYYEISGNLEELKRIAGMWMEAAKYKEAVIVYDEFLDKDTKDEATWVYVLDPLKRSYIKVVGKDKWLERCKRYTELFPNGPKDFYISDLLDVQLQQGDYDGAIKNALEILQKDPNSKSALVKLGEAYDAKIQHKEAIDAYERAYKLDDKDADLICKLARVYLDAGNRPKTWSLSLKAMEIKKFGQPYFLIGLAIIDGIKICSGNVLTIEAKEANMVALKYFDQASGFPDTEKNAKSYASVCRQNGVTKSDSFMGSLGKLQSASCYSWMLDRDYVNPYK